ncbi:MAG: M48 family metallopeptidase [Chloroflexi bacterium]|nr:M48 family metallopeptidase [Chloroflexota bacterium]
MLTNPFFVIILAALGLEYVLHLAADLLNLSALGLDLPPALQGAYRTEDYRSSQAYGRATLRFDIVARTYRLLVLLVFWLLGGFNYLDQVIRAWGFVPVVNGLLYIGILLIGYGLLTLPLSAYATFVIEQRFGFNRTALRTFLLDRVKGLALALSMGGPLLAGILLLFEHAGPYAWLYSWAAIALFSLVIQFVAPTWIMPLFNKFTPMEAGDLKNAILAYARSASFPLENVFVVDSSRRSSKSNAFFTGFGRNRRIALFDTLIARHTLPEMVAVLAHEIGHYKKKHIWQGTIIGILHMGVVLFLLSFFIGSPGLYRAFYMGQPSIYAGLVFFGLLYTPIEMLLSLAMHALSRRYEYEADRFAAETIEKPQSLVDALVKLHASNLANLSPHPFYVFLNYSHPSLLQRVQAIRRYQAEHGTRETS